MGNTPLTVGLKVYDNGKNGRGVVAGSLLHGRIYLSNRHKSKVHGSSIRLKLIGTEEAVVHHQTTETQPGQSDRDGRQQNQSYTQDHYERSSDTIYDVDHTIKEFPGGVVPRGQFEFPFALELPKHLPSSMKAETHQSHCEVRYEIIAEIFQKSNSLLHRNPHAKERLTVIAMPSTFEPDDDSSRNLPTEIIPISNCHCCRCCSCTKIGTMALETRFDKTTLLLDSPSMSSMPSFTRRNINRTNGQQGNHNKSFGVQFRCENKSTAEFRKVRARLTETIEWHVHGHTKNIVNTLASSTVDASMYPELKAMWRKPFFFEEHRRNGPESSLLLQHMPWRSIDPSLGVDAASALDTYNGRAVQVRHVLTLSVITKNCCVTNPDASTRVEIYRNPLAFGAEQHSPEGFAAAHKQPYHTQPYHQHTSSAPFEDEPLFGPATAFTAPPAATAPSAVYDSNSNVPMAEAQLVLPEDWNAQAEEVVNIPIAEATVVGTSFDAFGGHAK